MNGKENGWKPAEGNDILAASPHHLTAMIKYILCKRGQQRGVERLQGLSVIRDVHSPYFEFQLRTDFFRRTNIPNPCQRARQPTS